MEEGIAKGGKGGGDGVRVKAINGVGGGDGDGGRLKAITRTASTFKNDNISQKGFLGEY